MKQLALICLAFFCLIACTKETLTEQPTLTPELPQLELKQYKAPFDISKVRPRNSCSWIEIEAGSNNALTQAIADACEGGIIYLKAGEHTETERVIINKNVKIIGEYGATLKLYSSGVQAPDPESGTVKLNPSLHVYNAPGALIQDLSIQPIEGDGASAILLENSNYAAVMRCQIDKFQNGVVIEKSNFTTSMLNNIVTSSAWQTGNVVDGYGIVVINGESAYVADNIASNALFGIWGCDKYGTCERNTTFGSFVGTILCNVPADYMELPSGELTGAQTPGSFWKVKNNNSHDNLTTGYLVIDGANNNLLENNNASNNGEYDIDLTTETPRFGFLVPGSYDNTVNAGNFQNVTIKNCGINNTINGGILIDNSVEPCN